MSVKEAHARIQARVWQAIAQKEIDVSALDKPTLDSLINLVTEAALLEIDAELGQSAGESAAARSAETAVPNSVFDNEQEDILWEGRPFLSLTFHYTITDERIRITEGLLGKARENVELVRIQDMDYSQTFGERMLNLGDIKIRSHDPSHPEVVLRNITDPESVYEILRRAVLHARKKHNFTYREEM
ncbi:MAG: PH domain-containing protein [Anaerolineales bacterium]|nr:PH domain-containing protein [Anaerolineales bacterium]